jgi:hypothetical protein
MHQVPYGQMPAIYGPDNVPQGPRILFLYTHWYEAALCTLTDL